MYGHPQSPLNFYGDTPDVVSTVFGTIDCKGTCTLTQGHDPDTVRLRIHCRLRELEDEAQDLVRQLNTLPAAVLDMPAGDFFNLNDHIGGPAC